MPSTSERSPDGPPTAGEPAPVGLGGPARDPALGLFETLLARDGRIQALGAHLSRLARSARALYEAPLPPDLSGELRRRLDGVPGPRRVRVDARPAAGALRIEIVVSELAPNLADAVRCRLVREPGGLGPHKLADRRGLELVPARAGAADTALFADGDDRLLEAAWGNLWLLEGDRLITPPADGRILPGITRRLLLQHGRSLGAAAVEEPVGLDRARRADGILLTSSLRHAVAATLDGHGPAAAPSDRARELAGRIRAALGQLAWE